MQKDTHKLWFDICLGGRHPELGRHGRWEPVTNTVFFLNSWGTFQKHWRFSNMEDMFLPLVTSSKLSLIAWFFCCPSHNGQWGSDNLSYVETTQDQCPGQFWSHLPGFQGSPPQDSLVASHQGLLETVHCHSRFASCLMFRNLATLFNRKQAFCLWLMESVPSLASCQCSPSHQHQNTHPPGWSDARNWQVREVSLIQGSP